MTPEEKKYILENVGKKSYKVIAKDLGIKEKKLRLFVEKEGAGGQSKPTTNQVCPGQPRSWYWLLIPIVGFLIYSNSFKNSFHLDDFSSILENPAIRDCGRLDVIFQSWPSRFLTYWTLAINYSVGKLDVVGYHIFNLLVHLGCALLVYLLAKKLLPRNMATLAVIAGLIFVSHPIQTQAVTYIVQRAASLASLFYLLSVYAYLLSAEADNRQRSSRLYGVSLLAAVAAFFSKEFVISLPFILWMMDSIFLKASGAQRFKRLIPLFILPVLFAVMLLSMKMFDFGTMTRTAEEATKLSWGQYFTTQFPVVASYLRLLIWPVGQNLDHDIALVGSLSEGRFLYGLSLAGGLIGMGIWLIRRKMPLAGFGILWFFICLLPESGLIPIKDVMFEHRLYLPMAGVCFFIAGIVSLLGEKRLKIVVAILGVLVAVFGILAYARNFVWRDEFSLLNDCIAKAPKKARPYDNRGLAYKKIGEYANAIEDFNEAIEIDPADAEAFSNRGNILSIQKKNHEAVADYDRAITLKPAYAKAYNNRAASYFSLGQTDKTLLDLNQAITLNPNYAEAYANRGVVYKNLGNLDQAIIDLSKSLELDPESAKAYVERAKVYYKKGQYSLSQKDVQTAQRLGGDVKKEFLDQLETALKKT